MLERLVSLGSAPNQRPFSQSSTSSLPPQAELNPSKTREKRPSPAERRILELLRSKCRESFETDVFMRSKIAETLVIPDETVKTSIRRLIDKGLLERLRFSKSKLTGGTVYRLTSEAIALLLTLSKEFRELMSLTGSRISSFTQPLKPCDDSDGLASKAREAGPTSYERLTDRVQDLVERLETSTFKISGNDLISAWRKGPGGTDDELLASIEHLIFYLRSPESRGIRDPRAWVRARLREGYFLRPTGFKSLDQKQREQVEAKRAAEDQVAREQVDEARLREERQALFLKFEAWRNALGEIGCRTRLKRIAFSGDPTSQVGLALLRGLFEAETTSVASLRRESVSATA